MNNNGDNAVMEMLCYGNDDGNGNDVKRVAHSVHRISNYSTSKTIFFINISLKHQLLSSS